MSHKLKNPTEPKPTKRLRELDPPEGVGLGRVLDFAADHADSILAHQVGTGVKLWEEVDESVPVTSTERSAVNPE